jgi:hypothetical protein
MIPTVMDDEIATDTNGKLTIIVGKTDHHFEIWFDDKLLESIVYNSVTKRSYKGCKQIFIDYVLHSSYKTMFLVDKDVQKLMTSEQIKVISDQAIEG